jgi:hypothetical protein
MNEITVPHVAYVVIGFAQMGSRARSRPVDTTVRTENQRRGIGIGSSSTMEQCRPGRQPGPSPTAIIIAAADSVSSAADAAATFEDEIAIGTTEATPDR